MKTTALKNTTSWTKSDGDICTPKGFTAGGLHCGVKRKRKDLGWIFSSVQANAAAVYTTNLFQAPPLKVTQESIRIGETLQGVLVNSGNANSCTGQKGLENAYEMRRMFAYKIGLNEEEVAVVSTGVIGEQLPMLAIKQGVESITDVKSKKEAHFFQEAILTTDTFTKKASVELNYNGCILTIAGVAKGSGMVHPNMATMLGFITTDIHISASALNLALKQVTEETFNMITVDGDTSTNDMVLVMANGLAKNEVWTEHDDQFQLFKEGLKMVCESLAMQIARDGEGATKLIEVHVNGAKTKEEAQKIAKTIVGSSLVKTAVFGEDANWGRIVSAIGYSGVALTNEINEVRIGSTVVVKNGLPFPFNEQEAAASLKDEKIIITIGLDEGIQHAKAWGCDLSYDYVRINASYRT
ncbi:Arginine biosynthesis bifunctional protein ArgJ [Bacillus sp. THAF10]|uniref:bifunctional ornithine acetyltransferase/N-acetylglutamate synthase n=1 Tax=Bacillus sp. THAF10 TaxID=2587848 RepID=UPI001268F697|nr:bifunctional ornithine acetyltransferase/N-acetylglutamate synthase [Bacillus sp. THAF10]QFT89162.1 Arginine biosynthesis bifunctional protein ArgJ [Bacillus sp. THAF10]